MTNAFDDLLNKVENPVKTSNGSSSKNILVKGVRYEGNDTLVGVDLKTNEEIKVRLRDIEEPKNPKNSSFARITIAEMSDPKNRKRYADASTSEFLVESAYKGDDGIYSSRWIRTLKKMGVASTNLQRYINYSYYKRKDGSEVIIAKMLSTKRHAITSEEQFKSVLTEMLHPKNAGSSTLAYLNVTQEDDDGKKRQIVVEVKPTLVDKEDGFGKKCADGSVSVENFLENSPEILNLLKSEDFINGKVRVGLFKAFVVFPVGDTKESISSSSEKSKDFIFNQFKVTDENGKVRQGFKDCIISIRNHKDDVSQFFTSIDIVSHQDEAKTIDQF